LHIFIQKKSCKIFELTYKKRPKGETEKLETTNTGCQNEIKQLEEEVTMSKEENVRLKELVVTDPEEWGRTFERIQIQIKNTKSDIEELRKTIPTYVSFLTFFRLLQNSVQNLSP